MTVRPATKMWSTDTGRITSSDGFRRLNVSFQEGYQVQHDVDDSIFDIYEAVGLPRVADVYPGTDFVFASDGGHTKVSPILTVIKIDWRGEVAPGTLYSDPIQYGNPPIISWRGQNREREVDTDRFGNPIATVCDEPIKGVKALFPDVTLTIRRKFSTWNQYVMMAYLHAVNSDPVYGCPPGTAKVMSISADQAYDENIPFFNGTLVLQVRVPYLVPASEAWMSRVLHQGYNCFEYYVPKDKRKIKPYRVKCVDDLGKPLGKLARLNAAGEQIKDPNDPSSPLKKSWLALF